MHLEVPRYIQSSYGCGPTSLRMAMSYFGSDYPEEQILEEVGGITTVNQSNDLGTIVSELAVFAARHGFDTTCYTYNMRLLRPGFAPGIDGIDKYLEGDHPELDKRIAFSYRNLLEAGGKLEIAIPDLNLVVRRNFEKIPSVLTVNSAALYDYYDGSLEEGHTIVITDYDAGICSFNDPYDGEEKLIGRDKLMFAASCYAMTHSAYLILLKN